MIKEGKIQSSSSSVWSPILFIAKPSGQGLGLCVDMRNLNDHTEKDKILLPIMDKLQTCVQGAMHISEIDMASRFYFIWMALGHEKFMAFRTKFGLFKFMVMPFWLTNTPATFQREMNWIVQPLLGNELVINTSIEINDNEGRVVVAYIDNVSIAAKGSFDNQSRQVSKVFQIVMDNNICVKIDKCFFDATEVPLLGFLVDRNSLQMDPNKAKVIVNWPRPTNQREVEQILCLSN